MTNTELAKNELNKFVSDLEEKCNYNKIEIITSRNSDFILARKSFYNENNELSTVEAQLDTLLF